ncbi:putative hydrolase or acyltransferase of alpha/beta superfamily [Cylindrospermum stagnale PCC 7417]|uniref:Putative hydrolase or acyltransferase of alpha/beta superfamily n=1 Tax=Cylindrospermum stagnale PCC 7417 TaxID=56107 RepID=K9WSF1_9NOST|nr:alpha/beta hydrolase [Cylindrospermum stagnale]AFZ23315.1 putative hydrolase or acyltransferase of alpha/beta superfamily [Cylindrospermum stagnale PCC 7417]
MKDWWQVNFPQGRQSLTITDAQGYPVQIAYGEKGTGKPLILLHGLGSWSYNWRNSIEPLSKFFRVICFDAKGYGFSEKPLSRREQSGHQVIELERIIQALCDQPAVIVAESLGALVALALAEHNPQLIGRLVVINAPIFTKSLPHWAMGLLAQAPLELVHTVDVLRLAYLFAPLVREIAAIERRKVLFEPSMLTQEDVYWITYPFIELPGTLVKVAEELQIAVQEIENLQANKPNMLSKIQSNLSAIECPTLILWGDQDSWFPASHGEKLHQHLPNSILQILPNCYHDASTGSFKVVNAAILKFLQDTNFC